MTATTRIPAAAVAPAHVRSRPMLAGAALGSSTSCGAAPTGRLIPAGPVTMPTIVGAVALAAVAIVVSSERPPGNHRCTNHDRKTR
jgi:hypothetical protein